MKAVILLAAALLATPVAASAQGTGGTSPAPAAGATTAMPTDAAGFVRMATSSNLLEIESSRMALQRSRNEQVRAFAEMMVDDHTKAGQRMLQAIASRGAGATSAPPPQAPSSRHSAMLEDLKAAEPARFDAAYVQLQRAAHREAIGLFDAYARGGDDQALVAFARETLPVLRKHGEAAEAFAR